MIPFGPYQKPPPFMGTPIAGHPLGPDGGLVAAWLFNEGTGDRTHDYSGNGNAGTLHNSATWSAGRSGSAILFAPGPTHHDGAYISTPLGGAFLGGHFTLSIWTYAYDLDPRDNTFFSHGSWDFIFDYNDADSIRLRTVGLSDQSEWAISEADFVNRWRHICVTSTDAMRTLYVDGLQWGSPVALGTTAVDDNIVIGVREGGNYASFDGLLDLPMVYNRALTAAEVQRLYWEPYCWLARRASPAVFAAEAGGVTHPLSADLSASALIAAELNRLLAAAAALSAAGQLDGSLARQLQVAAGLSGSALTTGQIERLAGLASELAADASAGGGINVLRALASSISSPADTQASLAVRRVISAAISGSAVVSGDLQIVAPVVARLRAYGSVAIDAPTGDISRDTARGTLVI